MRNFRRLGLVLGLIRVVEGWRRLLEDRVWIGEGFGMVWRSVEGSGLEGRRRKKMLNFAEEEEGNSGLLTLSQALSGLAKRW